MEMYAIKKDTLSNIADTIRDCLSQNPYYFNKNYISNEFPVYWFLDDEVIIHYKEFIDTDTTYSNEGLLGPDEGDERHILAYTYFVENDQIMPVLLYDKHSRGDGYGIDMLEPLFWKGRAEINGELLDKWEVQQVFRSQEDGSEIETAKKNIYTDIVVHSKEELGELSPTVFSEKIREILSAEGMVWL